MHVGTSALAVLRVLYKMHLCLSLRSSILCIPRRSTLSRIVKLWSRQSSGVLDLDGLVPFPILLSHVNDYSDCNEGNYAHAEHDMTIR